DLPRGARAQSRLGYRVSENNLKQGDLMFFWVNKHVVGHVGIYAGNGKVIHTYGEGGVKYSNIRSGYWKRHMLFNKRIAR
ncbi:MAG: NlpC/P60 family protein, partial [Bacilli bacterium]